MCIYLHGRNDVCDRLVVAQRVTDLPARRAGGPEVGKERVTVILRRKRINIFLVARGTLVLTV